MPLDDEALYGRYKDLFPHILEVTNAKIQDMEVNEKVLAQAHAVGSAFNELSSQLFVCSETREGAVAQLATQLSELRVQLQQSPAAESQALALQINQLEQTQSQLAMLNDDLTFIKHQLNHIIDSRSELIDSLSKIASPEHTQDVTSQTDIELF